MRYHPNSAEERAKMLEDMGVSSIDQFFTTIPEHLRLKQPLNLPASFSETDLIRYL
ncbi:MAG: glycine dehydrogenase, partial [Blastocatellia bacterium]|nr:glycine dehydrogenase [Blastocatellia bacterium]